jgi:hypothetical protein
MRRLEALGKGILLLHDIHPTTVAALPGLLQQLKDNGFHIVQVVPAASYEIAMAKRPEAPMPTSELRGDETIIGNGMDHKTPASWPQTSANNAADDSTLPVPDPSTFEPDALPSQDTADVQWPPEPELTAEPAKRHARSEGGTYQRSTYMYVAPHRRSYSHKITHAANDGHDDQRGL